LSCDDWGSPLAPQQHSLRLQQVVVVVVVAAVAVEVVAVVVPHLVRVWWNEWTVMGGVLHCAPMCQQSNCNSSNRLQSALSGT